LKILYIFFGENNAKSARKMPKIDDNCEADKKGIVLESLSPPAI